MQPKAVREIASLIKEANEVSQSLTSLVWIGRSVPPAELSVLLSRAKAVHENIHAAMESN